MARYEELYSGPIKTAISLPDRAAEHFDHIARTYGMTRSEFYRRAAERYAHELADADLTAQINDAIDAVGQSGEGTTEFRRAANAPPDRCLGRVVIQRAEVCWVGEPKGSAPATRRPAVVVQSNQYNQSRIANVVVLPITSNTDLARHPGNVFVPAMASGLPKDSVVNVSQPMTVDRADIDPTGTALPASLMDAVVVGLRRVLDL